MLWGGGSDGTIWKIDPITLTIERSIDFPGDKRISSLAHDGTFLWVGSTDDPSIVQYNPSNDEVPTTYDYPTVQTVHDFTYLDDHLWLETDNKLLKTNIDKSTPTPTPSPTSEPTATPTPESGGESRDDSSRPEDETNSTPTATSTPAQEEDDIQDSDGDGVIDSEDYAPNDPEVQEKSDLQSNTRVPGFGFGSALLAVILAGIINMIRNKED